MARRKKKTVEKNIIHVEAKTLAEAAAAFHQTQHVTPPAKEVEKMRRPSKKKGTKIHVENHGVPWGSTPKPRRRRKKAIHGKVGTGVRKNTTGLDASQFRHLDLLDK